MNNIATGIGRYLASLYKCIAHRYPEIEIKYFDGSGLHDQMPVPPAAKSMWSAAVNLLKINPHMTQREMNRTMGVSLGKVNYCLSKLTDKGMIKVERFKKATNRIKYAYRLTPSGFDELARLILVFLKQRMEENDTIRQDIKSLLEQAADMDLERYRDSDLAPLLDKIEQNRKTDKDDQYGQDD